MDSSPIEQWEIKYMPTTEEVIRDAINGEIEAIARMVEKKMMGEWEYQNAQHGRYDKIDTYREIITAIRARKK